jgi:hypothetical protein
MLADLHGLGAVLADFDENRRGVDQLEREHDNRGDEHDRREQPLAVDGNHLSVGSASTSP